MKSFVKFITSLTLLLVALGATAKPNDNNIDMFTGEARVLPMHATRVAVGNGKVMSVNIIDNNQLLVLAENTGTSTLHVWLKDGTQQEFTVRVQEGNLKQILDDINHLLTSIDNVHARIAGQKIVLEGDLVSDANQERVQMIQKMYPDKVINFVGKVGWEKMVYLDVKVLELTQKGSRDLGIRWDSSVAGPQAGMLADLYSNSLYRYVPDKSASGLDFTSTSLPNKVWPPKGFVTFASLITSKINLLMDDGDAQLLAAPNLTTRSGSKAHFLAGGQIPLPVQNGLGQISVEFKDYGVTLDVTPVAEKTGAIYAKVEIEVSSIDKSVAVLGIPGFLTRKTSTEFNSRDGDAVVISGLYSYNRQGDTQKVPGLGDIPFLGNAFKDKSSTTDVRELAVIITPRIITPTPNSTREPKDLNAQKLYEFDKAMRDNNMGKDTPKPLTITE